MLFSLSIALDIVLIAVLGFFILYLLLLSVLALGVRLRQTFATSVVRRFAVIIPAHNEVLSIPRTVDSLKNLGYPRQLYDVIVIADNCSDRTADVARSHGAIVYERTNTSERGKGYALRWCFDKVLAPSSPYQAIVVIDADTIVAPDFLTVMNFYLEGGSRAIQSSDLVMPQPESWSSEITRFGFTLYNYVRPLGRRVIQCSAGIRGNGMCFSADTLRKVPWNTFSLNEDLEFGLVLLLNGINVDFAPEARVYATMPASSRHAESQRTRWEGGRFAIIRSYALPLIRRAFAASSYRHFDAFVDLVTPPFVNLFGLVLGCLVLHVLLVAWSIPAFTPFAVVWGIFVLSGIGHVFIGLYAARADALLYKAFFNIPRYVIWKIMLYGKALRRPRSKEWVRTTRDASLPQDVSKEGPDQ